MKRQRQEPSKPNRPLAERRRSGSWWQRSGTVFGLVAVVLAALLMLLVGRYSDPLTLSAVDLWLIAINLVTFLIYGYDKLIAAAQWSRVPERLLLVLALVGGTIGALVAMLLFRHKTAKASFRLKFLLVVIAQIALASLYYGLVRPDL